MPTPIKWGPEFLVNTGTAGFQYLSAITGLADGRFVVTWMEVGGTRVDDPSNESIRAQIFAADGSRSGRSFWSTPRQVVVRCTPGYPPCPVAALS